MKKINSILVALVALLFITSSCEPEYFRPTDPKYSVGDLIVVNGIQAVVFYASFDGENCKAVATKTEAAIQWCSVLTNTVGANSFTDGKFNQQKVQSLPSSGADDWRLKYPVFWQCFNVDFPAAPVNFTVVKWYLPSVDEMKLLFNVMDQVNAAMPTEAGVKVIRKNTKYWTSTEVNETNVKMITNNNGVLTVEDKMKTNNDPVFRAIITL
jgi:hypothetical protein